MTSETQEAEMDTSAGDGDGIDVRDVGATVADAGRQLRERAPEVLASSRTAMDEANRLLQGGSGEALWIGGTFSVGLAVGLFIAGAPRLLVLFAIGPALAVAGTLLGRRGSQPGLGM